MKICGRGGAGTVPIIRRDRLATAGAFNPRSQFLRLKSRRGPRKAIIAVAGSILTAAYFMLRNGTTYKELGDDYFERGDRARAAVRLVRRLQRLGYTVQVEEAA